MTSHSQTTVDANIDVSRRVVPMTSEGVAVNFAHLAHVHVFGSLRQGSEYKGKNFWCNNDIDVDNRVKRKAPNLGFRSDNLATRGSG